MFQCQVQQLSRSNTDVHTPHTSSAQNTWTWNDSSYLIPPKYLLDKRSYQTLCWEFSIPKLLLAKSKYGNRHFKITHQGLSADLYCCAINALQPINTAVRVTTAMQTPVCPDSALPEPPQSHLSPLPSQDCSCHTGAGWFQVARELSGTDKGPWQHPRMINWNCH